MTTSVDRGSEWTAAAVRPTATWVPVSGADGRSRLEMVWSVPTPDLLELTSPTAVSSTGA
jgi:hypothetical protein